MLTRKMNITEYKNYIKKPNKYNAKRTMIDGINFHSKKEAAYYQKLKLLQKSGEVTNFEMQVPFQICRGRKYLVDFIVYYKDNFLVEYIDCKGFDTPIGRLKRAIVEDKYGIKIEVI